MYRWLTSLWSRPGLFSYCTSTSKGYYYSLILINNILVMNHISVVVGRKWSGLLSFGFVSLGVISGP